jgi:hypothetical protein
MVSEGRLLWERLDVDYRADATTMRRRRRWQSAAAVRDPLQLREMLVAAGTAAVRG